ncbi:MAG TPA: ATP-binding cassette domain-containing protein [Gammaproteobacteria bacterium]|nr:ATP-binding cassette domain-containing protein [Gammaproteobacteria bacterium]
MSDFNLSYPSPEGTQMEQVISTGHFLFLVGANGTGKSTLMHSFAAQHTGRIRRITAHRQVWFNSDSVDITPAARIQTGAQIVNQDRQAQSRWKDEYAAQRSQVTIFDLIDSENEDSRNIANAARSGRMEIVEELAAKQAPISKMNDILRISNLHFQVRIDMGSKLIAEREGYPTFSIAELSDGERNSLLIIANVLTAPEGTLILLDEPERHLHRSIVSPLLSTLLSYRDDCAFVISTHDVSLPLDQNKASALLVRSYNHSPQSWLADYIEAVEDLDEGSALAILGSRRKILFIEGNPSSLDIQIYHILFPDVSIRPVGSCVEVEKIVKGLRSSDGNHWVSAYGVIDKDNRSDEECALLLESGIAALDQYSIESIYYHPIVINGVLNRVSEINGLDIEQAIESYTAGIVSSMNEHKDRMAARLVERKVRDKLLYCAPNWRNILSNNTQINISTEEILNEEKNLVDDLLVQRDVAGLVSRYPIRETPSLESVSNALGYQSKEKYEQAVRKMLCDSEDDRRNILNILNPISNLLQ